MFSDRLILAIIVALLFFLVSSHEGMAQMSSSSYKIPLDSVDVGGGLSNSASYQALDSVGEVGTGDAASSNYKVNSGFLAVQNVYLSITQASDVALSPSISGVSGGSGTGSTSWTVVTDNPAGYTLNARATTSPALKSGTSSFADYTPAGSDPDYNWSISSSDSEFGFSPEGPDIIQKFKDNGSSCNTGALDSIDQCWAALSTSDQAIAQRTSGNHPSGTTTTIKMKAESGTNHLQPGGSYSTTIIVTALPL